MSQFTPTFFVSSNDPASPDTVTLDATDAGTSYEIENCGKYPVFVMVNDGDAIQILPRSEGTVAAANNAAITKLEFYLAADRVRYVSLSPGAVPAGKAVCKVEIKKHA